MQTKEPRKHLVIWHVCDAIYHLLNDEPFDKTKTKWLAGWLMQFVYAYFFDNYYCRCLQELYECICDDELERAKKNLNDFEVMFNEVENA